MRQSSIELVTEVINNTCTELIQQLRRQFQNDSASLEMSKKLVYSGEGRRIDTSNYYSTILFYTAILLGLIFAVYQVFAVVRVTDKLVLTYRSDSKTLQEVVKRTGLDKMAFRTCLAGQFQKVQMPLMVFVETAYHTFCTQVTFHREIFRFHDGGQCALDWAYFMPQKTKYMTKLQKERLVKDRRERGNHQDSDQSADQSTMSFLENNRPILVCFLGMCSDENEIYIQNFSKRAFNLGYQPVLIQFRGASGVKLTSPKTYGCGQWQDVEETVSYIYDEYCKSINRQIFAIGFSLGGNWLVLALGKSEKLNKMISASSCIESPLVINNAFKNLKQCWNGLINWNLGQRYRAQFKHNQEYLAPHFKQQYNIDLRSFVKRLNAASQVEEEINWKMYGQKNFESYQQKFSAHNYIQNVKVPLLVYHTDDDPIICPKCVPYEKILQNNNIMIASNKYGGHLSSHISFFSRDQFFVEPPLEFFSYFKEQHEINSASDTTCFEKISWHKSANGSKLLITSARTEADASQNDISILSSSQRSEGATSLQSSQRTSSEAGGNLHNSHHAGSAVGGGGHNNNNGSSRRHRKKMALRMKKQYISI